MLFVLEDGTIKLTRGDTARFRVGSVYNVASEQDYEVTESDILELSIKKTVRDESPLVHKQISGTGVFHIEPSDTKSLEFGKYIYDVQLTTLAGDVYTIIEPTTFEITKEVT